MTLELTVSALKNCGAFDAGAVPIAALEQFIDAKRLAASGVRGAKSLICGIFPYFFDLSPGSISLYARGEDYHKAIGRRLDFAVSGLRKALPHHEFWPFVDASPFPEVRAAAMCGLGMIGKNSLLIRPPYGSFLFIGTIASTIEAGKPWPVAPCQMCGKCEQMCPGGAISDAGVDSKRCLSAITQRKGELSHEERAAVLRGKMAWGCDVCQKVCPMNRDLKQTALGEFKTLLVRDFEPGDGRLSKREFMEKYGNRAFAWRGPAPIARNLRILGLEE